MKKNNKGFTLVELIVVIAILGVLMAVLVPQYIQYVEKSRIGTDESMLGEIAHNMEIGAATTEGVNSGTYTATIDDTSYEIATTATDDVDATAAATALENAMNEIIPTDGIALKSKEYKDATSIVITMTDGIIVKGDDDKLWTAS